MYVYFFIIFLGILNSCLGNDYADENYTTICITTRDDEPTNPRPGTVRWALECVTGPRIIACDVSGIITLQDDIHVTAGCVIIAGETAPGLGITITGGVLFFDAVQSITIRHMRIRPGDDCESALVFNACEHVLIDHCSFSWSTGPLVSLSNCADVRCEYTIFAEPLWQQDNAHGYDGIGVFAHASEIVLYRCICAHARIGFLFEHSVSYVANTVFYNYAEGGIVCGSDAYVNLSVSSDYALLPGRYAYKAALKQAGARPQGCIDERMKKSIKKGLRPDCNKGMCGDYVTCIKDVGGFEWLDYFLTLYTDEWQVV